MANHLRSVISTSSQQHRTSEEMVPDTTCAELSASRCITDTFAVLKPLSPDAVKTLDLLGNGTLMDSAAKYHTTTISKFELIPLSGERVARLGFNAMFSRRELTFGSQPSNNFRLPVASDVGMHQFALHFELQTGILLFTDTSNDGTWIFNKSIQQGLLLHRSTYPLIQNTTVAFGQDERFRFSLTVTDYLQDIEAFEQHFRAYTRSIFAPPSTYVKSIGCIPTPLADLGRKYTVLHRVAQGAFSDVSTCLRFCDGKLLAVKKLVGVTCSASGGQPTEDEARLLRRAAHPNVVAFVDELHTSIGTFLVMEFLPHGSLADMLDELGKEAMAIDDIQQLLKQCLSAIGYLHRQSIIHHDIKPDNILIQSRTTLRFKICDFGLAERLHSPYSTEGYLGTSGYMAPELSTASHSFGVDVWALGIVTLNAIAYWPWEPDCAMGSGDKLSLQAPLPPYQHLPCSLLLNGMLSVDYKLRYTAERCLEDSWLTSQVSKHKRRHSDSYDQAQMAFEAKTLTASRTRKRVKTESQDVPMADDEL